jgi:hypothetical protein
MDATLLVEKEMGSGIFDGSEIPRYEVSVADRYEVSVAIEYTYVVLHLLEVVKSFHNMWKKVSCRKYMAIISSCTC